MLVAMGLHSMSPPVGPVDRVPGLWAGAPLHGLPGADGVAT